MYVSKRQYHVNSQPIQKSLETKRTRTASNLLSEVPKSRTRVRKQKQPYDATWTAPRSSKHSSYEEAMAKGCETDAV